jgi:BMFP domain-containing protein YqiC
MLDPKRIEEITARISASLASGPAADIEKNLKSTLSGLFHQLDLVTREEFDIQADLLARSQARLAQLEARLAELEQAR